MDNIRGDAKMQCIGKVRGQKGMRFGKCQQNATVGDYCKAHDPIAKEAKQRAEHERQMRAVDAMIALRRKEAAGK
jgi:hypothetical protein